MPKPWNAAEYLATYADLQAAYGPDPAAAAWHWQVFGQGEGRVPSFDGLCYIASYPDLIAAYGADPTAGAMHWIGYGRNEGRAASFDGLDYIASYPDLIAAFGPDQTSGALHWIVHGRSEGRTATFDAAQYLANYADLRAAFGADETAAARHFIVWGAAEGRTDQAAPPPPPEPPPPEPPPPPGMRLDGAPGSASDTLVGGDGPDTLHGGFGADIMTGGGGADTFHFGTKLTETGAFIDADTRGVINGAGASDTITDFQPGQDRIDVSAWGTHADGDHFAITFIGTAPFSHVGPWPRNPDTSIAAPREGAIPELRYEWRDDGTTHLLFDGPVAFESLKHGATPMDAIADAEIILIGHHILTAGDVVL